MTAIAPDRARGLASGLDSFAVEAEGNLVIDALGDGLGVISPDGVVNEMVGFPGDVTTNMRFRNEKMNQAVVSLSGSGRLVDIDSLRSGLELGFSK